MRPIVRWVIAWLTASGLMGAGLAQIVGSQAGQFRELFLQLDANQDGAIEKDEVPPSGRPAFERLLKQGDRNHNGKLEADEYRAVLEDLRDFAEHAKKQAAQKFQMMDKDRDGKVSRAEFTGPRARFDLLDRNADGFLTRQEFLGGAVGKVAAKKKGAALKKSG
jgi:Ca2+-binding EF-hand superfamily protein